MFLRKEKITFLMRPKKNTENMFQLCASADYKSSHAGVLQLRLRSVTLFRYFDNSFQP